MKIIHKDTGKTESFALSGVHTICECGKWVQDNLMKRQRHSKNWELVNCKKCLKKVGDQNEKVS
jgi:hypothetical protein